MHDSVCLEDDAGENDVEGGPSTLIELSHVDTEIPSAAFGDVPGQAVGIEETPPVALWSGCEPKCDEANAEHDDTVLRMGLLKGTICRRSAVDDEEDH